MFRVTTKANKNSTPSPKKDDPQVGKFQGIGLPATVGKRPGTFTNSYSKSLRIPKALPPLKFN